MMYNAHIYLFFLLSEKSTSLSFSFGDMNLSSFLFLLEKGCLICIKVLISSCLQKCMLMLVESQSQHVIFPYISFLYYNLNEGADLNNCSDVDKK